MIKKKTFAGIDSDVENFISKPPVETKTPQEAVESSETSEPIETPRRGRKPGQKSSTGELDTRTDRITLYFTAEIMDKIALIARAQDKSKNKFLTEIIEKEIQKEKYGRMYEAMKNLKESF
jgi:hypothetical protein